MASRSKPLRDGFMRGLLILLQPLTLGGEFMKLWTGQTLSAVTDNVVSTALSIIVLERTGSATAASVGLLLQMLPALLLGPVAGVILDRTQRKWVMAVADAARASGILLSAYAITSGTFSLAHVYAWRALNGIVRAFYDPATNALIPAVVERESIQQANAVHTVGKNTAMILGPAVAGFALAALGDASTLLAAGLVFAVAALLVLAIKPRTRTEPPSSRRPSLAEAWRV